MVAAFSTITFVIQPTTIPFLPALGAGKSNLLRNRLNAKTLTESCLVW